MKIQFEVPEGVLLSGIYLHRFQSIEQATDFLKEYFDFDFEQIKISEHLSKPEFKGDRPRRYYTVEGRFGDDLSNVTCFVYPEDE